MENKTIVIMIEDGLVNAVLTEEAQDVIIMDFDTDTIIEEDLVVVPDDEGTSRLAYIYYGNPQKIAPLLIHEIKNKINEHKTRDLHKD